jgi:uncharacterized 2Fe-2S/4Fe-4S cluster protein (DUF4445 family)
MLEVKFVPENVIVKAETGETLLAVARRGNVFLDAPCNGQGTCGKCKMRIVHGAVQTRKSGHLTEAEAGRGVVLACSSTVTENITVEVPDSQTRQNHLKIETLAGTGDDDRIAKTLEQARQLGMSLSGEVRKEFLKLDIPSIDDSLADWERVQRVLHKKLGYCEITCSLAVLRKIPRLLRESNFQISVTYMVKETRQVIIVDVEKGYTCNRFYGAAIDVGTTSVAAVLVNLREGKIIAKAAMGNAQVKYGADVINRIIYAAKGQGIQELNKAVVRETINPLLRKLCREARIEKGEIVQLVAAGNTTMMHLLLEVYPDFLRREPYIPAFTGFQSVKASELGLEVNPEARLHFLPSVSSYVGGDITGGVLASGLWATNEKILFLDLGTNGEIVFGNHEYMLTCACSAGPAFEGGEISCGMRAMGGAIEKVQIDPVTLEPKIKTVYGEKPQGICGSGLIDSVAEMFKAGIIDRSGKINQNLQSPRIRTDAYQTGEYVLAFAGEWGIDKDIILSDVDLDNFVRAKGAVYAAVSTLLKSIGMDFTEIDRVLIAGGIGSNINIFNCITIGLFPDIPLAKYEYVGNSSLMGSFLVLISADASAKAAEIAAKMTYVELSTHPFYMSEFVAACFLPHTDTAQFPNFFKER